MVALSVTGCTWDMKRMYAGVSDDDDGMGARVLCDHDGVFAVI